jgi:hypothetical protein
MAATAAGVGVLCLTQTVEAKVVYTPANVKIVQNAGLFRVDLNHDGIADFALSALGTHTVYWVWFDDPQFDADGDGPYSGGQVWESALNLQAERPN